jgi:undecaprenyl-diphosphatase
MTPSQAFILGIVQGITEFLPVSSSGHLQLVQYWLGINGKEHALLFSLACHLGTLCATLLVLRTPLLSLFNAPKKLGLIAVATIPLFPLVFFFKPIKAAFETFSLLGFCFLATSLFLFLGVHFGKFLSEQQRKQKSWRDALCIGAWQACALLPGVSRSGATISGARLLGWSAEEAILFSFFLAIPATLGSTLLELSQLLKQPAQLAALPLQNFFIAGATAFACGWLTFRLLLRSLHHYFSFFAWYCLFLGLATVWYFNL